MTASENEAGEEKKVKTVQKNKVGEWFPFVEKVWERVCLHAVVTLECDVGRGCREKQECESHVRLFLF